MFVEAILEILHLEIYHYTVHVVMACHDCSETVTMETVAIERELLPIFKVSIPCKHFEAKSRGVGTYPVSGCLPSDEPLQ